MLARCLPDPNKEIFFMSLPKWVLPFLTNQVAHFISCGDMGCFNSSGNILCLHDFKILVTLVKSRQRKGVPFHVLALFVCC